MVVENDKRKKNNKDKKRRSMFSEADELEKKLAAAREKAASDIANSLTMNNTENEVVYRLLSAALDEILHKTNKKQNDNYILGSMEKLSANIWKKKKELIE